MCIRDRLSTAQITPDYPALDEAAKCDLLMALLQDARPLRVMGASYSAHALNEIGVFEAAKNNRALYGAQAIRHYIISHTETVSDLLEVLLLQKDCLLYTSRCV